MTSVIAKLTDAVRKGASDRVKAFAESSNIQHNDTIVVTEGAELPIAETENDRLVQRAREEYDRRLKTTEATIVTLKEKLENIGKQRLAHEQLKRDAEKLEEQCEALIDQTKFSVEMLEKERERAREEEIAFERARAEAHERAVKAEQKRVEAQAVLLLNQQRLQHAKELQEHHAQGIEFTNILEKKHQLELTEASMALEKTRFVRSNVDAIVKAASFKPSHIEFEVGVQPQEIPESHIYSHHAAHGISLRGVIEEKVSVPTKVQKTAKVTIVKEKKAEVSTR